MRATVFVFLLFTSFAKTGNLSRLNPLGGFWSRENQRKNILLDAIPSASSTTHPMDLDWSVTRINDGDKTGINDCWHSESGGL